MKFTRTILAGAIVALMAACSNGAQNAPAQNPAPAASSMNMPSATNGTNGMNNGANGSNMMPADNGSSMMPANSSSTANATQGMNWFGGPIYNGEPSLKATAALVKAGGGAENFSFSTALVSMLGEKTVNAEVDKLTKQYGKDAVQKFIKGMTFDVKNGLKRATEAGVKLPDAPADLKGKKLAEALVDAGTAPDGTFWAGYMFDHTLSHKIHNQVMADVDANSSHENDKNTHKILNQAMYDAAQALGKKDVKLAELH